MAQANREKAIVTIVFGPVQYVSRLIRPKQSCADVFGADKGGLGVHGVEKFWTG